MRFWPTLIAVLLGCGLCFEPAFAQVYVYPRRPGKSKVEYLGQDWQTVDLLDGTVIDGHKAGGIRLFFYQQEREIALRAAANIEKSYRYLAGEFDYVPERRFPYVLYSSYSEFTRTNLFPIQEGVLGVTSPQDLEVTLPYFGDHREFERVSTHELAHQFTIQKVDSLTRGKKVWGDPLSRMPDWFVEGLAEYYAQHGIDPETEMLVRDMVANPDLVRGYGIPGLWDDFPGMTLWTYKAGQVRCAFLEEVYGRGTIQKILEASPDLINDPKIRGFRDLVSRITGDDPEQMDQRYKTWLKRRVYPEWLSAQQDPSELGLVHGLTGYISALAANDDGSLVLYRTIDPYTGRNRLYVADPASFPHSRRRITIDGRPGVESLHPTEGRNFDARKGQIVYVSESRGRDVLHWLSVDAHRKKLASAPPWDRSGKGPWYNTRIHLRDRHLYRLGGHDLIAIFSPVLSPDASKVAFIGLGDNGIKDIYVFEPGARGESTVTRLTDDAFAERGLAWGKDGIVYTSDATEHGKFNLFRIDPKGGKPVRLTTEDRDEADPMYTPDGRLFFSTWRQGGHTDLYQWTPKGVVRRTDLTAGISQPAPGPDGGLWVLLQDAGQARPALVRKQDLLDTPPIPQLPGGQPHPYATASLDASGPYHAYDLHNWRPDAIIGYFGAGPGGIYGQVYGQASDKLRNNSLLLSADVYGRLQETDGYLAYMNQGGRITWGAAAFHLLRPNLDHSLGKDAPLFSSEERYYGGLFTIRYPFGKFSYIQLDQAVGAAQYSLYTDTENFLADSGLLHEWRALNDTPRFQIESTFRVGYDTIRYHALTGPIAGNSVLFETVGGFQPIQGQTYATFRLDAEHYVPLPLIDGANLGFRGAAGTSLAGRYGRSFLLSSFDTLRGVHLNDPNWLLGRHYWFAKAELQVPLSFLLRSPLFSSVEGICGFDFGAVGDTYKDLWAKRVLDIAIGGNIAFGPLVLRLQWAHPFNIGAPLPAQQFWVPNISLSYLQL